MKNSLTTHSLTVYYTDYQIHIRHAIHIQNNPARSFVSQPASGRSRILDNAQFQLVSSATALIEFCRARWLAGWQPRLMFVRQSNCGAAQQPLFTAPWREASKQKTTDYCDVVSQCMFVRNSHRTDGQVLRCCAACRSSL